MIEAHRMLPQSAAGWGGLAAGVAALAVVPMLVTPYYVGLATTAMIGAMLALSLHLLVGATGLVSLGHGAFFGLAAYVAFLMTPAERALPLWQTLPVAMMAAGFAALLIGSLSLRTKGFFFLMVTLAFGQMIYFVFHDTNLGGGTDGAYLAKPYVPGLGTDIDARSLTRVQRRAHETYVGRVNFYVALVQMCLVYLGLALLLRSLFGRVLEGIKVNEHRMEAMGFNARRYKLAAFTIAGLLAGAAGHMWAMHTGFVNPDLVSWHKSAEALLMILLGGIGSLAGAAVGAFALHALGEGAQVAGGYVTAMGFPRAGTLLSERKLLVEGVVILAVVLLLRNGLMGIRFAAPAPVSPGDGAVASSKPEVRAHG